LIAPLLCCGGAVAQAQPAPSGDAPRAAAPAEAFADSFDATGDDTATGTRLPEDFGAATPPAFPARDRVGWLDMLAESLCGNRHDLWRPLPLSAFFTEGWRDPWYSPPHSTTGAPRQAWINAYDGVFYRIWLLQFEYANRFQQNGNGYAGSLFVFLPVSQRFQVSFNLPFITSDKGGLSNTYHGNVGDFAVSPRFLLSESQNLSQVVECIVRTPTGSTVNGNGQTTLTPQYEFWYGGLPGAAVIRGGAGMTIPTNTAGVLTNTTGNPMVVPGSRTTCNYNLAIGKYWTPHEAPLADFVTFLSANGYTTVDDRGPAYSYASLTPGFRFHLGNNYYFTAGLEVPLTGPKDMSFAYSPIFWIVKVW
jgi:hypothetical protein